MNPNTGEIVKIGDGTESPEEREKLEEALRHEFQAKPITLTEDEATALQRYPESRRHALWKQYRSGRLIIKPGYAADGFIDAKTLEILPESGKLEHINGPTKTRRPANFDHKRVQRRKIARASRRRNSR